MSIVHHAEQIYESARDGAWACGGHHSHVLVQLFHTLAGRAVVTLSASEHYQAAGVAAFFMLPGQIIETRPATLFTRTGEKSCAMNERFSVLTLK
jgi:hypothetical protein